MFNGHTMTVVNDLAVLGPEINNVDFMSIAAVTLNPYPDLPNIYNAGILVPPTEFLMAWADGDRFVLQNSYPNYLMSKDCDDMITALLAALTNRNVVLYIPNDDMNIYGGILLNHIYLIYGITCNYMSTVFSFDQTKLPFVMSRFYMIDVMEANDYLSAYPAQVALPDFVINKLAEDLQPFNRPATFQEYVQYFNQLNASKGYQPAGNMCKIVEKKQ